MNSLEELRKFANQIADDSFDAARMLSHIADRIEAEYMEIPKDADGVPCRLGDHVKSDETCGDIKEMLLFGRGGERWEIYLTTLDDSVPADSLQHVEQPKPETIDDVRNEITKDWDYAHDLIDRAYECGKRDAQ